MQWVWLFLPAAIGLLIASPWGGRVFESSIEYFEKRIDDRVIRKQAGGWVIFDEEFRRLISKSEK